MRHHLPLIAALALAGCETFVDLDPADFDPELAVSGPFETGVPWSIEVSQTVALNGPSADGEGAAVLDAAVEVVGDGGTRTVLTHVGEGRYESPGAPVAGTVYTLSVRAPGFPEATATSTAPALPESVSVGGVRRSEGGGPTDFELSFDDPAAAGDLYELSVYFEIPQEDGPPFVGFTTFTTPAPVRRESTFLDDIQTGSRSPRYTSVFLDDERPITSVPVSMAAFGEGDLFVTLAVASEEYYEQARARVRQREAARNPFAEPVPAYSNVRGGYGEFVGVARRSVPVRRSP